MSTIPVATAPTTGYSSNATASWRHGSATIASPSSSITSNAAGGTTYSFRLHYVDIPAYSNKTASAETKSKGTILLIHGFPETWFQWRHVITPLSTAGYRVIVPDYRGAGNSQAPPSNAGYAGGKGGGYTKVVMADDLHTLVQSLDINEPIHVVGHDIGAMIAHSYATWFAKDTKSLIFVDCPLPGSKFYHDIYPASKDVWHFTFHNVEDDLPETLVKNNERTYMRHFFDRLCVNPWAIVPGGEVEDAYVLAYSRPGAMRAAFDTYRAFDEDARENKEFREKHGKSKVPALAMAGDGCFNAKFAKEQLEEFYGGLVEKYAVKNSGHYISDEAPVEMAEAIVGWVGRHG